MKKTFKILFIFSTLILSACAKEKGTNINQSFSSYTNRFEMLARSMNVPVDMSNISISFDESLVNTNILGTCSRSYSGVSSIKVNPSAWAQWELNKLFASQEQLMFHELGHCVLNRDHRSDSTLSAFGGYVKSSIMNPYHLGETLYAYYYHDYIRELFTGVTPYQFTYTGSYQFPAVYYGGYEASSENTSFKVVAKNIALNENGEYDYTKIESFGCGEETHDHE